MDTKQKEKIVALFTEDMETQMFKDYLIDIGMLIPDYWFEMPASTTSKYHSKQQCVTPGGQVVHCLLFKSILNHLLRLQHFKEKFDTPEIRDCLRCAPLLHDSFKKGINNSKWTVPDHPKIASEFVLKTKVKHDIEPMWKKYIAGLCEAHSGEWNKNRSGQVIMKYPENDGEMLIHMCDILSSRNDIIWDVPSDVEALLKGVEVAQAEEKSLNVDTFTMPFGKYKGMTLMKIKDENPGYIDWMKQTMQDKDFYPLLDKF